MQDDAGSDVLTYALLYGPYPIAEAMEDPNLLDEFGEKEIVLDGGENDFTITLDSTEVDANDVYYALILPKDDLGLPGEISNDVCFKLEGAVRGQGTECDGSVTTHSAGGADMNLANISHAINEDMISLRWTALEGANKIDLFVRDPQAERFQALSTIDMSAEQYSFRADRNGEFNVKFIPTDGSQVAGTEVIYTFTVDTVTKAPKPTPT